MLKANFVKKILDKNFKNKTFIITGYSTGIGKQVSHDLKKLGSKLIFIGRKKTKNKNFYECDLRNTKKLEEIIKIVTKKNKIIDGFAHSAGINECVSSNKISIKNWQEIISVNLTSAFIISKEIKKKLEKSSNPSIVFISSIAGHRKSIVSGAHYVSSKAALIGLAKQLSHEFGKEGIRVNCISPSQTITSMLKKSMTNSQIKNLKKNIPLKRLATPKDQSYGILFLLSTFSKYISGTSLNIDGGQI